MIQGADKGHVRIDISVNEAYDGSYSGNPHDLIAQPLTNGASTGGAAFGRQGPTRRAPVTATLVWRPRRLRAAGHDLYHGEGDDGYEVSETQRPFITGHNRQAPVKSSFEFSLYCLNFQKAISSHVNLPPYTSQ